MVVVGTPNHVDVAFRDRVEIADESIAGAKQPYHAAAEVTLEAARRYIARCEARSTELALQGMRRVRSAVEKAGHEVVGCGMLMSSSRALPPLDGILASHALIHSADGEHFRAALRHACDRMQIPVTAVVEKAFVPTATRVLRLTEDELLCRLAEFGKALGPPWTQDQKLATVAGWLALPPTVS